MNLALAISDDLALAISDEVRAGRGAAAGEGGMKISHVLGRVLFEDARRFWPVADADLRGADDIVDFGQPNGWPSYGYRTPEGPRVQVGCRNKTLAEGRAYWSWADHPDLANRREVLAALDYLEVVARLRGWDA